MNYGYPGANSQFENHNVSEESFWPSFTDIMMVIVMVFLLVTVAVILNNWALISKLTTSIEAQEAATNLAENRQEKNTNLENQLSTIQEKLLALNAQFEKEKSSLEETELKLKSAAATLSTKEQSLVSIENKLSALNEKYEVEHQRLTNTSQQLSASEQKLSKTDKQLLDIKQQLANKVTIIASLDKKLLSAEKLNAKTQVSLEKSQKNLEKTQLSLNKSQKNLAAEKNKLADTSAELTKLKATLVGVEEEKEILFNTSEDQKKEIEEKTIATAALQKDRKNMDDKLVELLASIKTAEKTIVSNKKTHTQVEAELLEKLSLLQTEISNKEDVIAENKLTQVDLKNQLDNKTELLTTLQATLTESQKASKSIEVSVKESEALLAESQQQLEAKDKTIKELTSAQESGNSQLRSLQGEYDSLDDKYKKLLRPERSSKGKYVASVTYKKVGNKRVIRFKPGPNQSYRTVSKDKLATNLLALKQKHKKDLYIKVVIPKNSGLSYNEAWRFTINLQRKYDYYYND